MTQEQKQRLDELQDQVFQFINSIEDDVDRVESTIDIVVQAITGGERYFEDHKFILNESGKIYRKIRKEIFLEENVWDEFNEDYLIFKNKK